MPRGQPDFGIYQPLSQVAGLSDVGEAAVRLGSINIYDRKGWTIWQDDFEGAKVNWDATNGFGGLLPIYSSSYSWQGSQSLRLKTEAGAASYSRIFRYFSLVNSSKIGAEALIQCDMSNTSFLLIELSILDGVRQYRASFRYYEDDALIKIYTGGVWVTVVTEVTMYSSSYFFMPIKVVVEITNHLYDRLRVGEQEIDLSAYALENVGVTTKKVIAISLNQRGQAVGDSITYVDNFIFTQNEP